MYAMYQGTAPYSTTHYPTSPPGSSSLSLQQERDELRRAQERLRLQEERLKLAKHEFKAERLNWKRSHKIKAATTQYDDQSINSTSTPVSNDQNDLELIQELRRKLTDAHQETKLWKEKWNIALQLQESLQAEQEKIRKQHHDDLEKSKLKCAQAQNELEQQKNEWEQQQQANEVTLQCKLDDFRDRIRTLEGEKKNLKSELDKKQQELQAEKDKQKQQEQQEQQSGGSSSTEEVDRWKREAERLQVQLDETTKQFENLQSLVPRNKQLLEQAMLQQEKLRTKCSSLETKYEKQQQLVKELQAQKDTLTRKIKEIESGDCSGSTSITFVKTILPSEGPREWIREGRKHVVEWEWTSSKGLYGMYTGWLDVTANPHGHGTLRIEDGSIYDGEWIRGMREGMCWHVAVPVMPISSGNPHKSTHLTLSYWYRAWHLHGY